MKDIGAVPASRRIHRWIRFAWSYRMVTDTSGLVETAGQGECEPGLATPGEQPAGGDVRPQRLAGVEDQQQRRRVGGDVHVDRGLVARVDVQAAVAEGPYVGGLTAQAELEAGAEALDALGPDPAGQDRVDALDDQGHVLR